MTLPYSVLSGSRSYCVKDVSDRIQQEGQVGSTRRELDCWMKTLSQPWTVAMEATIFSGWIYDHLLPHATQIRWHIR
jgi:transposase